MIGKVGQFLGGNDLLHQFHRWVILTAVLAFLGVYSYLGQLLTVCFQCNVYRILFLGRNTDDLRLVSYGAIGDAPSLMTINTVVAVDIRDDSDVVAFVDHTGIGNALARLCISDTTGNLLRTKR
ncbi:MAG: hypothetical protein II493_04210 [Spirochaetales bacterium]|nr:hypothetical protein [Spirochaetales bacterium]